jgi:uncharacterized protein YukE
VPDQNLIVDPDELKNSSKSLESPIGKVNSALDAFYGEVNALPPKPWGTDEIGEKFAESYEGLTEPVGENGLRGHEALLQSLRDAVDGLQNMADRTRTMADAYRAADDANRS